jgi:hypothetical protein
MRTAWLRALRGGLCLSEPDRCVCANHPGPDNQVPPTLCATTRKSSFPALRAAKSVTCFQLPASRPTGRGHRRPACVDADVAVQKRAQIVKGMPAPTRPGRPCPLLSRGPRGRFIQALLAAKSVICFQLPASRATGRGHRRPACVDADVAVQKRAQIVKSTPVPTRPGRPCPLLSRGPRGRFIQALLAAKSVICFQLPVSRATGRGHRRPACVALMRQSKRARRFSKARQCRHGRDGHAPFFRAVQGAGLSKLSLRPNPSFAFSSPPRDRREGGTGVPPVWALTSRSKRARRFQKHASADTAGTAMPPSFARSKGPVYPSSPCGQIRHLLSAPRLAGDGKGAQASRLCRH